MKEVLEQKSNEIITEAQMMMDELEMKQDEVLLDITSKMPILQFGQEASKILKQVMSKFDDKKFLKGTKDILDSKSIESK